MGAVHVNAILQIGIVIQNADEAIRNYENLLGISGWNINYVDTQNGVGRNFRHGNKDVAVKAKIAWVSIGNVEIELIEPRDETSIYAEYLRNNGPGVHHLMFGIDDHQKGVECMRVNGVESIVSGELQATKFQLFDTRSLLGTITEFAEGDALIPDKFATESENTR